MKSLRAGVSATIALLAMAQIPAAADSSPGRDLRSGRSACGSALVAAGEESPDLRPIDLLRQLRGEAPSPARLSTKGAYRRTDAPPGTPSPRTLSAAESAADQTIFAAPTDDFLTGGYGVASADLDADGFEDLILGAYSATAPPSGAGAGAVHVLYGPLRGRDVRSLDNPPADLTISGFWTGEWFGAALATGDVSGDGVNDLLVGAPRAAGANPLHLTTGRVYVFFGPLGRAPRSSAEADAVFYGESQLDLFGYSLAAGDTDGDGVADLLVGAPNASTSSRNGTAYLLHGPFRSGLRRDLSAFRADAHVYGTDGIGPIGQFVRVEDVTGDGRGDLLLSQTETDVSTTNVEDPPPADPAYVVAAPHPHGLLLDLNVFQATVTVVPPSADDGIGPWLAAGDVTGDGLTDFVIAAAHGNGPRDTRPDAGEVYVLPGPLTPGRVELARTPARLTIYGDRAGAGLGTSLVVADVNGDGVKDLLLGSISPETGGRVEVVLGPIPASDVLDLAVHRPHLRIDGDPSRSGLGAALAAGDVSGDGSADILFGRVTIPDREQAFVLFGEPGASPLPLPILDARDVSPARGTPGAVPAAPR